jgi:hypothetical protein
MVHGGTATPSSLRAARSRALPGFRLFEPTLGALEKAWQVKSSPTPLLTLS